MKAKRKKTASIIMACVFAVLLIVAPFLCVFITGLAIPPQYDLTYYGELKEMYSRLKSVKGKKVVVIGNSNVAFGVDSALFEKLLNDCGLDYSVCNFGLYGALGTRMMIELSEDLIGGGDIVIFTPELYAQSLSLYFSAKEAWYALDGNLSMFKALTSSTKGALVGNFSEFVSGKRKLYVSGQKAEPSGIYAKSSFDGHCDLKNYARPYNVLVDGADTNNAIALDGNIFGEVFVDYINEYYSRVKKKGAKMFYSFAPMNRAAITKDTAEKASGLFDSVSEKFDFPVMGDIDTYIMDYEWFYDSNFHLNSSGMTVRTVNLVNDLKTCLGNNSKTEAVLPEKPVKPQEGIEGEGDNSCAQYFNYEIDGNYYVINGLTAEGAQCEELIVPYQVDGLYVKSFKPTVFAGNNAIKKITVQKNIKTISDNSFEGCTNLEGLYLQHSSPSEISVGYRLLYGTSCNIYVLRQSLSQFKNNYFWGHYASKLQGYN